MTEPELLHRWSHLTLGKGCAIPLRNRVVIPSMASASADEQGFATQATLDHYRLLTQAGAALISVEYTFVSLDGRSEPNQLGASKNEHTAGLTAIASLIRSSGAVAGLQLVHGGGKTSRDLTGGPLLGPSAIPVPVKGRDLEVPTAMTASDIIEWKQNFLEAAQRAVQAGFQAVELHAAHGYGFNQWLSPLTNHRTDIYGGSRANRARLLIETIRSIRSEFPSLIMGARIPGQDFIDGGLTLADMIATSRDLVTAGLDYISVSSGLGGWRRPGDRSMEGYLIEEARAIQREISCPIIGVGGIETGGFIDELIRSRSISLAAVGRAILANPAQWGSTNLGVRYDNL